jgi:ATP-binding cassette subfamily C protein LapB
MSNKDNAGKCPDVLLECLVYLTRCFGRPKSAAALIAGLPYDEASMGPELFCEAAEKNHISAQIVKRASPESIKDAVLPAVLILKDQKAVVLLRSDGAQCEIYDPADEGEKEIAAETLKAVYTGFAILAKPQADFIRPDSQVEDHNIIGDKEIRPHWFWSLVESNRNIYSMALLGALFVNLFALTGPLFIMNVYDRVIPNNAIETGWALGIGALVIYGFDLAMRIIRAYLIDFAGRRIDVIAARRIFDQVLNMRIAKRPRSSGVFANMLKDFDSVRDFFTSATITVLVDLPFSLFFLFVIYKIGGGVAFILAGLILAVFMIGLVIQIPLKKSVRRAVHSSEAKHGLLVETIAGLETIKTLGADGLMRARYMSYVGENAKHGQTSRFWSGLGVNIAAFLQNSASVIVVLLGMYLVRDSELTMGGLIACVILGGRAISPIGQIANLMARYHQAGSALKTIEGIMNQPVDRPEQKQFLQRSKLDGKIVFDKVSFSYPQVNNQVLDGVSFFIEPGEKVGIIGRIGSGKSTIAKLLMGLYEPDEGTILLDDTDMRQIDPVDVKRNIAYISQDVTLFSGSVRDNIALSMPHATEDMILDVAKASGVHDFISRHPMGYDAPVGEQGSALSGGQRQSIALARAMLVNPQVLVCDEPTNAMDSQAEKAFGEYIGQQIKGRTVILITHKQHMLNMVNRLILVDRGKMIMDGPRDKVIEALKSGNLGVQAS